MKTQKPTKTKTLIIVLALLGLGIMSYLTYIHYANAQSFCDLSAEVSCDVVTTSIYSEIFGIPVSVLGILYFGIVLLIGLTKSGLKGFQWIFFLTAFVLIPSLYLTLTEIFFIHSFCILCESSKVLMLVVLIASFSVIKTRTRNLGRLLAPILIAGVVISGVVFFAQTGTVVKEDHSDLVKYMNEQGWTYYKSYTCSNCRRQEKLLGQAYEFVNSVECHPDGPDGNSELCLEKGIDKTPTWILERDGEEVMRLEGLQPIEKLTEVSGFKK
jgi:uncharacterized membrane protein